MIEVLTAAGMAWGFVFSLYIWKGSSSVDRDHPDQICKRSISTTVFSLLCLLLVYCLSGDLDAFRDHTGVPSIPLHLHVRAAFLPLFNTMILFLGPITKSLIVSAFNCNSMLPWHVIGHTIRKNLKLLWYSSPYITFRNLLAGPVFEEIVYRSCICGVLRLYGWTDPFIIITAPLLFGLSHVHHLIDHVSAKQLPFNTAVAVISLQLCYTTLFGSYATFVFLRTKCIWGCMLSHVFCNFMGLPELDWAFHKNFPYRWVIAFAFVTGLFAFTQTLYSFTETP